MFSAAVIASVLLVSADVPKPSAEDLAAYQEARAKAGRSAEAQVKLALWCEAHGLSAERMEHLAIAVMTDPANAAARGLLGLVSDGGRWRKPEDVAAKIQADARLAASLAEYNERRARAPRTAEGHWRLALWCEGNGLKAEATAHLTACVRLDPNRAAAWKKLGYKRIGGRWTTDEQVAARKADAQAQANADRKYRPLLASWRSALKGRDQARKFEAEKGLNSLKDPRAARAVWWVFVLGAEAPADLVRAVQLLGQLDVPLASKGLALIALEALDPEVRRAATETLARRDPRDYMGDLITLLREEMKWEVRPVGGPGSPGVLFVEGEQFRRTRVYAPPAIDFDTSGVGGQWTVDDEGFAVLAYGGAPQARTTDTKVGTLTGGEARHGLAANDPRAAAYNAALGANPTQARKDIAKPLFKPGFGNGSWLKDGDFTVDVHRAQTDTQVAVNEVPIGRMVAEYQKSAEVAEAQLEADVNAVRRENVAIRDRNGRIADLLNNLSNQSLPAQGKVWKAWWADQRGYAYVDPPAPPKVEVEENVPLAYLPRPIPGASRMGPVLESHTSYSTRPQITQSGVANVLGHGLVFDCFAAGTPVRTRLGERPIEQLEVGDSVLAQDMKTGALAFKPILAVYKFRPAETMTMAVGDEVMRTTPVHRFWRIGDGWVMARDLRPGDTVRTLGGSAKVGAVERDVVRPVFNLEVADSSDYFVGRSGILAGDNTLQNERVAPFDAAAKE